MMMANKRKVISMQSSQDDTISHAVSNPVPDTGPSPPKQRKPIEAPSVDPVPVSSDLKGGKPSPRPQHNLRHLTNRQTLPKFPRVTPRPKLAIPAIFRASVNAIVVQKRDDDHLKEAELKRETRIAVREDTPPDPPLLPEPTTDPAPRDTKESENTESGETTKKKGKGKKSKKSRKRRESELAPESPVQPPFNPDFADIVTRPTPETESPKPESLEKFERHRKNKGKSSNSQARLETGNVPESPANSPLNRDVSDMVSVICGVRESQNNETSGKSKRSHKEKRKSTRDKSRMDRDGDPERSTEVPACKMESSNRHMGKNENAEEPLTELVDSMTALTSSETPSRLSSSQDFSSRFARSGPPSGGRFPSTSSTSAAHPPPDPPRSDPIPFQNPKSRSFYPSSHSPITPPARGNIHPAVSSRTNFLGDDQPFSSQDVRRPPLPTSNSTKNPRKMANSPDPDSFSRSAVVREERTMTSQDVRRQSDALVTPPRFAGPPGGGGFVPGCVSRRVGDGARQGQDVRMVASGSGIGPWTDDKRVPAPAPSAVKTPEKTTMPPRRFIRQATPTIPPVSAPPAAASPVTTATARLDLGPYAEYFQSNFLTGKKVKFFDSHTHVDFALNKLEASGVKSYDEMRQKYREIFPDSYGGAVQVFCHPSALRKPDLWTRRIMEGTEGQLYFAFGLHPNWADQWDEGVRKGLEENLRRGKGSGRLVALGEIGLDYSRTNKTDDVRLQQKQAFEEQLELARRENLPVVIHCRCDEGATGNDQAEIDCLALCVKHLDHFHNIHRHCFTGSFDQADQWRNHFPNIVFGFTPPKGGRDMPAWDAIQRLPLTAILLETDAPYFLPTGMRNFPTDYGGRVAIPGGLALVTAVEIAKLREESVLDVITATNENLLCMYGITVA